MNEFLADDWRTIFEHNRLRSFDDFWQREIAWFENPNFRRGGWSGVGRWELATPDDRRVVVFVKRQENHVTRTLWHPVRGMATLRREFQNLRLFRNCGVPTPALLFFAEQRAHGDLRAMLITEELAGFQSLAAWTAEWLRRRPSTLVRQRVIESLAHVVSQMHLHRIQHNCLYAKHVFLRLANDGGADIRLIDLEKAKRRWRRRAVVLRDLDTLNRHSPGWSTPDRVRFLKSYLKTGSEQLVRPLWQSLVRLAGKKET